MSRLKLSALVDRYVMLRRRRQGRSRRRRGVLLISSGGLGDTILFSLMIPRFRALAMDGEPIHVLVQTKSQAVAFLFPPDVRLIGMDYRRFLRNPVYRLGVCLDFNNAGYRLVVSADHLRLPTVDDVIVMACNAEYSIAMEPRSWPKHDKQLLANRCWYDRWVKVKSGMAHRAVRWTELANALTARDDPPPMVRFAPERVPNPAKRERPFVVLHPFSAVALRQHPIRQYRRIIDAVKADFDVILSAGPGDLARNPEYSELAGVIVNEEGLEAKAALLGAASLVASVDTSVMHLAAGIGVPTLCLAGAAHVVDSIPYDIRMTPDNVVFLYHDMECRGCLGECIHPPENGVYPCVARLDPDKVTAAVLKLLKKGGAA